MSFLQEKENAFFWRCLLGLCAAWLLGAGLACGMILRTARQSLREREAVIVSGLLARGVAEETAAAALDGGTASAQGWAFLERTGRFVPAGPGPVPGLEGLERLAPALLCGGTLLFCLCLLIGAGLALARREAAYDRAAKGIEGFLRGDFGTHLSAGETGSYYRLLSAAEELARALQSRNEEEHRSKRFLQDMISDISHQLKTPLAALSLYLDIIGTEAQTAQDTVSVFAGKARLSVERMESLILSLLKMARLDVGGVVFERRDVRAGELAERAVQQLLVRAEREQKRLCLEGDPRARLCCDPVWTAEALENLVKNALDHTDAGGRIRVAWESLPGCFRLSVSDDGCGIAPEDIYHIFKRFYRGASGGPAGEGAGLGLPLARAIAEGQGGVLSAESEPGEGSVFFLTFPQEAAAPPPAAEGSLTEP